MNPRESLFPDARSHAVEASRLLSGGEKLVTEHSGPGEPSRIAGRKAMSERAQAHALTALALAATATAVHE